MDKDERGGGWGRRIRNRKLKGHQYREEWDYRVEWYRDNNVKHMWEQVQRAMVEVQEKYVAQ